MQTPATPQDLKPLHKLNRFEMHDRLKLIIGRERKITAALIEHLAEVQKKKFYCDFAYPSLFEYLVKEFGYSASAAYRRVEAAKALLAVPEIRGDLQEGSLNLTQLSQMQSVLKKEEKLTGEKITSETKRVLLQELKNKTTKETEKILAEKYDQAFKLATEDRVQENPKANDETELILRLPKHLMQDLETIRCLYSHIEPGANWIEVLELMAKDVRKKRDPLYQQRPQDFERALENCETSKERKLSLA